MPNEKYKKLLNINYQFDPVLDFRDKVVEMRRMQTKYNKRQGLELLYETLDAENKVDFLIFGIKDGYIDDGRLSKEKKKKINEGVAN
jgi:hypothetical protein